ncbi:MAG: hypothetical protein IJF34_09505, partial [Clostridia bacterium]|nr:hypothetical protein [Clostridia bacterium]
SLRTRSTISSVLQFLYLVAYGIAVTIPDKTILKVFAELFSKSDPFPFTGVLQLAIFSAEKAIKSCQTH